MFDNGCRRVQIRSRGNGESWGLRRRQKRGDEDGVGGFSMTVLPLAIVVRSSSMAASLECSCSLSNQSSVTPSSKRAKFFSTILTRESIRVLGIHTNRSNQIGGAKNQKINEKGNVSG